jgi:hypothetical protein
MLSQHRIGDEPCPVADQMLGEMYRADSQGLNELIATVPPIARALLTVYCYRRAHLASIGLVIAATCEEEDLISLGGNAGAMLFERSRKAPIPLLPDARVSNRRKITLAVGPISAQIQVVTDEDPQLSIFGRARARLWPKADVPTPRSD